MSESIVLPQTITLLDSLFFITTTTGIVLGTKFWLSYMKIRNFYKRESILILDHEKLEVPLIKKLSTEKIDTYPNDNNIVFSIPTIRNRKIQFVEIPYSKFKSAENMLNRLNYMGIIFSMGDEDIAELESLEKIMRSLGNKPSFLVAEKPEKFSEYKEKGLEIFGTDFNDINLLRERIAKTFN